MLIIIVIIVNFNTMIITTHFLLKIRVERETINPTLLYITYVCKSFIITRVSEIKLIYKFIIQSCMLLTILQSE